MKAEPSRRGHFSARNHAASPTLRIVNLDLPSELRVTGTLKYLSLVIAILPRRINMEGRLRFPGKPVNSRSLAGDRPPPPPRARYAIAWQHPKTRMQGVCQAGCVGDSMDCAVHNP